MGLFGPKKNEDQLSSPVAGPPVDEVRTMKQQGMSDSQIVQTLQRNGHKSHHIFDAMNQAELTPGSPQGMEPAGPAMDMGYQEPMPDQGYGYEQPFQDQGYGQQDYGQYQQPVEQVQLSTQDMDRFEEIAESIIDEKWSELMDSVNKIVEWKDKTDEKIVIIEQRVTDLKKSFDELNKSIFGRMAEYDKSVKTVGTDVKAMEKVFKDIIPTLTASVNELSSISRSIRK